MHAIVVERTGGPEVLQFQERPHLQPRPGWVLIRVKAFGLNRSEMFTRQGHSPGVHFPRVLGIECVGTVEAAPETDFTAGQTVAAVMGGLGRDYDGGYAEYTLVPASQVMPFKSSLPWEILAAIPEMFLTACGSLDAMDLQAGQTLLIRGSTSSVGMAAISIARDRGIIIVATTRNASKAEKLHHIGVHEVVIDTGEIAPEVRQRFAGGVNGVLELVGATTLLDSLRAVLPKGIVCHTGVLGNAWILPHFEPMTAIPSTVRLTTYTTETVTAANSTAPLQHIIEGVEAGRYSVSLDRVFQFREIVEAHRYMEENRATGKLVVLV